jgi:hypothetical protein
MKKIYTSTIHTTRVAQWLTGNFASQDQMITCYYSGQKKGVDPVLFNLLLLLLKRQTNDLQKTIRAWNARVSPLRIKLSTVC